MSIQVKVMIQTDGGYMTKMVSFPLSISVHEANQIVREKLPDGGVDCSLFMPFSQPIMDDNSNKEEKKRKWGWGKKEEEHQEQDTRGIWMKLSKTLESYDVGGEDVLLFRKRHVVVKVKTADESTKAVIVDLMQNVKEVVRTICQKFGLDRTDEYAIQWEHNGTWLLMNKTLTEQGDSDKVLVLKKRFFVTDSELDKNSPIQLHLAYIQGREMIISGLHATTKDEAAMFGALQAQVEYGIFNPHSHKPGFLQLNRFLPPQHVKAKDVETMVLHNWKSLGTMTQIDAKYRYHLLCMTLRTYGTTIFAVGRNEKNKKNKTVSVPMMLGFSATEILLMSEDCKITQKTFPYAHLRKWNYREHELMLDFGEFNPEGPITFTTDQGAEIASLIAGYIDILVRINKSTGEELQDRGDVAELQSVGQAKGRVAVGMTTSMVSGSTGGMDMITQITDLNSFKQAFQSYQVPTLHQLSASAAGTALTFEQLSNQMQSHGSSITRIADQMEAAARAHNAQELCNLSKNMGMVITNILQDAQRAAVVAKDPAHKQRLLESCTTVLHALDHYTSALMAYEANPCDETKAVLDLAKLNLENAVEAVMASMRNIEPDPDMGSLLLELAKNVGQSVDEMVKIGSSSGAQQVQLVSAQAAQASAEMLETVEVLGQFACDPAVRDRIHKHISKVQPTTARLVGLTAQSGTAMAEAQQLLTEDVQSLEEMLDHTRLDIDPHLLPYLRASHIALNESERIMADPQNVELVSESAKLIKETIPVLLARAKELGEDTSDGSGARMLEYARQATYALKTLFEENEKPANQRDVALVGRAAEAIHTATHELLGDDELKMHKAILLDRSKLAAASVLRVGQSARTHRKTNPGLLAAAKSADKAVQDLLAAMRRAVGSEGDDRLNVNSLSAVAEQFVSSAENDVINPVRQHDPTAGKLCDHASADVQSLADETQQFRVIGRLADIEYAVEPFRAAEAMISAMIFANDAGKFPATASREEVLQMLRPAAMQFGQSLHTLSSSVRAGEPFTEPLGGLASATQQIIKVAMGLVANSRFKHERNLLVEASRQLAIDVNKLIGALQNVAMEKTDGVMEDVVSSISSSVASFQKIVALSQQEGGNLQLDNGDLGEGTKFDAALEGKAYEALKDAKDEIDFRLDFLQKAAAGIDRQADPRNNVNGAIMDSVVALVHSTAVVVDSASGAQKELIANLNNAATRAIYARDPALAQGLIDAARHVIASINDLTRGLDGDTISTLSQQELASHAEGVSKSVEILASAVRAGTKVRSDNLFNAARAVSDATRALLEAAKMIEDAPEQDSVEADDFGIDAYTMQEIKVQMHIAELEHMLEKARKKYDRLMKTTVSSDKSWTTA